MLPSPLFIIQLFEKSGGWIATPTAIRLVNDIEALCNAKSFQGNMLTVKIIFLAPPKWKILSEVLEEIKEKRIYQEDVGPAGAPLIFCIILRFRSFSSSLCFRYANMPPSFGFDKKWSSVCGMAC